MALVKPRSIGFQPMILLKHIGRMPMPLSENALILVPFQAGQES